MIKRITINRSIFSYFIMMSNKSNKNALINNAIIFYAHLSNKNKNEYKILYNYIIKPETTYKKIDNGYTFVIRKGVLSTYNSIIFKNNNLMTYSKFFNIILFSYLYASGYIDNNIFLKNNFIINISIHKFLYPTLKRMSISTNIPINDIFNLSIEYFYKLTNKEKANYIDIFFSNKIKLNQYEKIKKHVGFNFRVKKSNMNKYDKLSCNISKLITISKFGNIMIFTYLLDMGYITPP